MSGSDSLQEKLKNLTGRLYLRHKVLDKNEFRDEQDEWVAQILSTFQEAGYIDATRLMKVSDLLAEQAELLATMTTLPTYAELITESQKMDDQEFYDRYCGICYKLCYYQGGWKCEEHGYKSVYIPRHEAEKCRGVYFFDRFKAELEALDKNDDAWPQLVTEAAKRAAGLNEREL
jgi:hypothetical protein